MRRQFLLASAMALFPVPVLAQTPAAAPAAEGMIRLGNRQIEETGIRTAPAAAGSITRRVQLPGTVMPAADRLVRVPARVAGFVTELRHRLGDQVEAGAVLGVISSREFADAKAEFLAAQRSEQLARTLLEREQRLWDRRVSAEQEFLRARNEADASRIRLQLSEQKLTALGLTPAEIAGLPRQPVAELPRRELRAPIAGRVSERNVDLGSAVTAETQAFAIIDMSALWVEMSVSAADLPFLREGQPVELTGPTPELRGEARLIFLSPTVDNTTRLVRAVAELPNPELRWRPGIFVTASVATDQRQAAVTVPRAALQEFAGQQIVFVRNAEGFERRAVRPGNGDTRSVEITSGLGVGEQVAISNVFLLRAELNREE